MVRPKNQHNFVRSYKPGYDWSRGGRLKEIRIRTIARKYLNKWKLNVYGRVLPSTADDYYQKQLTRKAFNTLYADIWTRKINSRLRARAIAFDKIRLLLKCFTAWKNHHDEEKLRNNQEQTALRVYETSLTRAVLSHILSIRSQTRENKILTHLAIQYYKQTRIRRLLRIWRLKLSHNKTRRIQECVSTRLYKSNLIKQAWLAWKYSRQRKADLLEHREKTERLRNNCLLHRTLLDWRYSLHDSRRMVIMNESAAEYSDLNIKKRWLYRCMSKRVMSRHHKQVEITIKQLHRQTLLRNVVNQWKRYVVDCQERRREAVRLQKNHHRKIKEFAFTQLKLALQIKQYEDKAVEYYERTLLNSYYTNWCVRYEKTEELKSASLYHSAHIYHRKILKMRYVIKWRENLITSCTLYLNDRIARQYRTRMVLNKYLAYWRDSLYKYRDSRTLNNLAILSEESNRVRKYFFMWSNKMKHKHKFTQRKLEALLVYERSILTKCYIIWRAEIRQKHHRSALSVTAGQCYDENLQLRCLGRWYQMYEYRKNSVVSWSNAESTYNRLILQSHFNMWRRFCVKLQEKREEAEIRFNNERNNAVRACLLVWKKQTAENCEVNNKISQFVSQTQHHTLKSVFQLWYSLTQQKLNTQKIYEDKLESFKRKQQTVLLRGYLLRWKSMRDLNVLMKLKHTQSEYHHERITLNSYFQRWKNAITTSHRVKNLRVKSELASNYRILRITVNKWRKTLRLKHEDEEKDELALWHWSFTLQLKCLKSLQTYTANRRSKRRLYDDSQNLYRIKLLNTGVDKCLLFAGFQQGNNEGLSSPVRRQPRDLRKESNKPAIPTYPEHCLSPAVSRKTRTKPVIPSFLLESLENEGLVNQLHHQRTVVPASEPSKSNTSLVKLISPLEFSPPAHSGAVTSRSHSPLRVVPSLSSTSGEKMTPKHRSVKLLPPSVFKSGQSQPKSLTLRSSTGEEVNTEDKENIPESSRERTTLNLVEIKESLETHRLLKTERDKLYSQISLLDDYIHSVRGETDDLQLTLNERTQLQVEVDELEDKLKISNRKCTEILHQLNQITH